MRWIVRTLLITLVPIIFRAVRTKLGSRRRAKNATGQWGATENN